jgi:hypothetical protein
MLRFVFSLVAASLIVCAGFSALGTAASTPAPSLKVIAVVVAHAHRHATVSTAPTLSSAIVQ